MGADPQQRPRGLGLNHLGDLVGVEPEERVALGDLVEQANEAGIQVGVEAIEPGQKFTATASRSIRRQFLSPSLLHEVLAGRSARIPA